MHHVSKKDPDRQPNTFLAALVRYARRMFRPATPTHWLLGLGMILGAVSVWACSVPVFRYALEHWQADPYRALVFHRGPLTAAQQALARDLGAEGRAGRLHANLSVQTIDLDNPPTELAELARQTAPGSLPWLVVNYPAGSRLTGTAWSGPLNAENIGLVLDSPARQAVTQRLTEGQSAVWVLLESGDATRDTAAAGLLNARLKYLASVLQLPKLDAQDIANGLVSVGDDGLRLEFSVLRLARNDLQEQAFVQMLLGLEADLTKEPSLPIVFPIFGQGRALYALVGEGIKHETIDQAAMFLIGKCSCQVKEQNPGADLLIAANWKQLLQAHTAGLPDLPTMAQLQQAAPETVVFSGGDHAGPTRANMDEGWSRTGFRTAAALLGGVATLLALGWWFLRRPPSSR